jgi:hypothetical protein
MHRRLQLVKKTLQIPSIPLMAGSSPMWMQIEAMLKDVSLLQYPDRPFSLLALQFRGHKAQFSSSFNGPVNASKFKVQEGIFVIFGNSSAKLRINDDRP